MTRTYAQTRNEIKRLTTPAQRKQRGIKLNASHDVLKQVLTLLEREQAQAPQAQPQTQETTTTHDHAPEIARLQALLAQAEADRDSYFIQLKQAQAELATMREQAPAPEPAFEPQNSQTQSASSTDADSTEQVSEPEQPPVSQTIIDKLTNAINASTGGTFAAITFAEAARVLNITTPATLHAVLDKLECNDIVNVYTCADPLELDAEDKAGISKWGREGISGGTDYYIRLDAQSEIRI